MQLSVNVAATTPGFIVAFAPQTPAAQSVRVPVTFSLGNGGGTITYHDYTGQQCRVAILVGQPYYTDIGAQPLRHIRESGDLRSEPRRKAEQPALVLHRAGACDALVSMGAHYERRFTVTSVHLVANTPAQAYFLGL